MSLSDKNYLPRCGRMKLIVYTLWKLLIRSSAVAEITISCINCPCGSSGVK
jgi:hypothetical protein